MADVGRLSAVMGLLCLLGSPRSRLEGENEFCRADSLCSTPGKLLTNLICANPLDLLLKAQAISSDALRLSEFLKSASKRIAAADETTLNQFFVVSTVEKISAMETADFFQRRNAGASGEFES